MARTPTTGKKFNTLTEEMYREILRNRENTFGRFCYERMKELGIAQTTVVRRAQIARPRFLRLLQLKEYATSADVELIFKIANALETDEVGLLILYHQSHSFYYSPVLHGPYKLLKFTRETLATRCAAFQTKWESLVHSPYFEEKTEQEQNEVLKRSAQLDDLFFRLSPEDQERLLSTAKAWVPDEQLGTRPVSDRSEQQIGGPPIEKAREELARRQNQ